MREMMMWVDGKGKESKNMKLEKEKSNETKRWKLVVAVSVKYM